MRRTLGWHFLGFVCLSSCGGSRAAQVAPDAAPSSDAAEVTEAAVDAGAVMVGTATGTELFSVTQVQATLSHCDDQDQAQLLPNPPTIGGLRLLLEGAWIECPDATIPGPVWAFVLGSDKAPGTTVNAYDYYELLFDEEGGLVQAKGPDQVGAWGLGGTDIFTEPDAGDSTPISTMPGLGTYMEDGVSAGSYGYPILERNTPIRMYLYPDPTLKVTRLGDVPGP